MREYLLCHTSVLPDFFSKVLDIKEMLKKDPSLNVSKACEAQGISRSTFYKYRNFILSYEEVPQTQATIMLMLDHHSGTLSSVLQLLSSYKANILTISQNTPSGSTASVEISVDVSDLSISISDILSSLSSLEGVGQVVLKKLGS